MQSNIIHCYLYVAMCYRLKIYIFYVIVYSPIPCYLENNMDDNVKWAITVGWLVDTGHVYSAVRQLWARDSQATK